MLNVGLIGRHVQSGGRNVSSMNQRVIWSHAPTRGIMVSQECLHKEHLTKISTLVVGGIVTLGNPVRQDYAHNGNLVGGKYYVPTAETVTLRYLVH